MHYSLRIETNNFQTDSLREHKASEGQDMRAQQLNMLASKRPREERPLPAAMSRLDEETLKKMERIY